MNSEVDVRRVTDGIQSTLNRLASLVGGLAVMAFVIGVATFLTGMWVFDGSTGWIVIGGALCLVPVIAALWARFLLRLSARTAGGLVDNVRDFIGTSGNAARVLIDHDTGQAIITSSRNFSALRHDLNERRHDLPALYAGVRAIISVPGLAAITVLGMLGVGALGTILLIGGLID
ncbi:MAG: hypothetical protein Q8M22_18910 [Actinomycetota bacterium]|nr:hypothetical protein [Actinomycetota bacterium]